jgi:prolyl oligopeptidase
MAESTPLPYPQARTVDQTDIYFGTPIADPYRWMEDLDAPEVAAWVEAENALTQGWLSEVSERDALRTRLMELINYERFTAPSRRGTRFFYTHNTGLQNHPVVFWQEGLDGEPQVLIDPNTLSADGTVALSGRRTTDDGSLTAYSLAEAGSDWITWRVRDVTTGQDLPDVVAWSKFSSAAWVKDNSGFYYSGYGEPTETTLKTANYFHKVFFHALGTPQTEDVLVFDRPDDKELNLHAEVTDDGRYLLIAQSRGTSPNNQITLMDLATKEVHPLITTEEAVFDPIDNVGTVFFFRTTLNAPKGKVIAVDLTDPAREKWQTLIEETENPLDTVSLVNHLFIAQYLADAQSHVELHRMDGTHAGTLALPAIGTAGGFGGERTDTETFYTFTNFNTPATVYRLDLTTLASRIYRQPKLAYDPAAFATSQSFVESKDGTRVPLFLTHRKGMALDGTNPTLLYGYGGFNVTLQPAFSPTYVLWMEMGGVYAQAGLRGGGEYGEAWHEGGMKAKKQNVFDDFIACAEYLIASGYTSSPKLAIQGGSNGGLLVAACALQRPDLFGAAIAQVGVMDMLRFDRFTIGWAWKADYGSPSENEDEFRAIVKYSPLHNVNAGVAYPTMLITTADHDDRVFPAHSFKFAATMQAAGGPNPALIRVEVRAGHGAGMPLGKRVEMIADEYAFLVRALRMEFRLP